MDTLFIVRENLIRLFKKHEVFIMPALRFLLGLYVFWVIYGIGHIHPSLEGYVGNFFLVLLLALGFAVLPMTVSYFLIIASLALQYSAHIELAAVIFVFLLMVLLLYARMAPKESILILLTVISYQLGLPYFIPLLAGMYFSAMAIIPVAIGIFIVHFAPIVQQLVATAPMVDVTITEMPDLLTDLYTALLNGFSASNDWIPVAVVFAAAILVVHAISRFSIDFAKEIALIAGCVMMILA